MSGICMCAEITVDTSAADVGMLCMLFIDRYVIVDVFVGLFAGSVL